MSEDLVATGVYTFEGREYVPKAQWDALVERWCDDGATIERLERELAEARNRLNGYERIMVRVGHQPLALKEGGEIKSPTPQGLAEILDQLAEAHADSERLLEDARYLLSFVPPWAKEVPEGLCATMYGTGSAEGDTRVMQRVTEIERRLAECSEGQE